MNLPKESRLWKTLRPVRATSAWIEAFADHDLSPEERDALVDLVWQAFEGQDAPRGDPIGSAEIEVAVDKLAALLGSADHALAVHTLGMVFRLKWSNPRLRAIQILENVSEAREWIRRTARCDPSWMLRRAALNAMSDWPDGLPAILGMADDPHWRVRLAVVEAITADAGRLGWVSVLQQYDSVWASRGNELTATETRRVEGVKRQLWSLAGSDVAASHTATEFETASAEPLVELPDWAHDPDPEVVAYQLNRRLREADESIDRTAVRLLKSDSESLAQAADSRLQLCGDMDVLTGALQWLRDPRHPGCANVLRFLGRIDGDRRLELARRAARDEHPAIRRWGEEQVAFRTDRGMMGEPEIAETLATDAHPQVRARALTLERARRLVDNPELETSWAVLRRAAELTRTPLPQRVVPRVDAVAPPRQSPLVFGTPHQARVIIPGRPAVAPLGLSGHYHLPERGFHLAVEAGVGLFFFEPNYATMTRFFRSLAPGSRRALQLTAGTFAADPKAIRDDIDRVLRALRRESIDLFLMFWVRSWNRISDEAVAVLEAARAAGKIHTFSLSTHNLEIAAQALDRGYEPVMVRHNAAHRRAEDDVLPQAARHARRVILFNTTCYGRLLDARRDAPRDPAAPGPTAADCIRYGLSQPGASACWTAPATIAQLRENLSVLDEPELTPERRDQLLERGARIRRMDRAVQENLRAVE